METETTQTVDSLSDLEILVKPLMEHLSKLPLKVWIETSRSGCDPRFESYSPSNSYYIHARGSRATITMRVSDHHPTNCGDHEWGS